MKRLLVVLGAVLALLLVFFARERSPSAVVGDTVYPGVREHDLSPDELPETVLPLAELPEEFLAEIAVAEGASVAERMARIEEELHIGNSGYYVRNAFPDLELLFTWTPESGRDRRIFPFFYYYSPEADTTFAICNIDKTVAVCEGRQEEPASQNDSGRCTFARPYEREFVVES